MPKEREETERKLPRMNPRPPGTEVASRWEQIRPKMMAQSVARGEITQAQVDEYERDPEAWRRRARQERERRGDPPERG